jgi:thiamine-phosphate pyrophosphorylase
MKREYEQYLSKMDYYFITDSTLTRVDIFHDTAEAVAAGCVIVQYRGKNVSDRVAVEEVRRLGEICRGRALLVVNDRVDIACVAGANGVHLGRDDLTVADARKLLGPEAVIGQSAGTDVEARESEEDGADYVGLAPIYPTSTKLDAGPACGLEMVRAVRAAITVPIVAVGGISLSTAGAVVEAGADAIVAISTVIDTPDVGAAVRAFRIALP